MNVICRGVSPTAFTRQGRSRPKKCRYEPRPSARSQGALVLPIHEVKHSSPHAVLRRVQSVSPSSARPIREQSRARSAFRAAGRVRADQSGRQIPGLISTVMRPGSNVSKSDGKSASHPLVSADKAPTRKSRTRSNRPAWGAKARRSPCIRRNTGMPRSAWSRSLSYHKPGT